MRCGTASAGHECGSTPRCFGHGLSRTAGVHQTSKVPSRRPPLLAGDTESALALFVSVSAVRCLAALPTLCKFGAWPSCGITNSCRCHSNPFGKPAAASLPTHVCQPTHVRDAVAQTSMRSLAGGKAPQVMAMSANQQGFGHRDSENKKQGAPTRPPPPRCCWRATRRSALALFASVSAVGRLAALPLAVRRTATDVLVHRESVPGMHGAGTCSGSPLHTVGGARRACWHSRALTKTSGWTSSQPARPRQRQEQAAVSHRAGSLPEFNAAN